MGLAGTPGGGKSSRAMRFSMAPARATRAISANPKSSLTSPARRSVPLAGSSTCWSGSVSLTVGGLSSTAVRRHQSDCPATSSWVPL